ncbi:patatin-like phospholipase family protein [Calidifontibacter sp. DB0510]|uniref:Patatin-like phospholipase family protein n=1 Tax=Metallococcus carri TaxID=1656884 RepID=A0A967EGA9_9MICO|nr:patatin-like phospholipase family protein [Metallococcus carri]NHN57406.1 patatin-like phospholipase family protein [Metallococcus carri]NOP39198.1 patatin-like phospholipase family protein [Calidifontibacter sp. DB2511S]
MTDRRPTTAFVLGGGGVLGATQIGSLRALFERDIRPDLVVGTSIGAVNGAFVAANPSVEGLDDLAGTWSHLTSVRGIFEKSTRSASMSSTGKRRSRVRAGRLRTHVYAAGSFLRLLREELPVTTFEELAVPFQCVAASVERSVAHWFSSGPLAEGVLASCAVPGLFPPIKVGDEHFFDGGLVHSIPVGRAVQLGAERIYVLHVGRVEQPLAPPRWPWEVGQVAFEIARRHRYMEEIATLPATVEVTVLPSGTDDAPTMSLLHLNRAFVQRRIESAYDAAARHLDEHPLP